MFKRRTKPHISRQLRNLIWPHIGWRRSATYLWHRVARLPGTPYSVAAGLACGVAVSCTPFVGFHILLGALIAWLVGANVLASVIGTSAGNPWTFPVIWIWIHELGQFMGIKGTLETVEQADFAQLFGRSMVALLRFDFGYLYEHALPVLLPMIAGSVPTAILVWIGVYFPVKSVVAAYQNKRNVRRERRRRHIMQKA